MLVLGCLCLKFRLRCGSFSLFVLVLVLACVLASSVHAGQYEKNISLASIPGCEVLGRTCQAIWGKHCCHFEGHFPSWALVIGDVSGLEAAGGILGAFTTVSRPIHHIELMCPSSKPHVDATWGFDATLGLSNQ